MPQDNYFWRIFDCLTKEGEVGPYQSVQTYWLFSPIEAKQYQVDVPLHVTDGDTHVISLTGTQFFFHKQPHFRVEPRVAIKIPKMRLKCMESMQKLAKLTKVAKNF